LSVAKGIDSFCVTHIRFLLENWLCDFLFKNGKVSFFYEKQNSKSVFFDKCKLSNVI